MKVLSSVCYFNKIILDDIISCGGGWMVGGWEIWQRVGKVPDIFWNSIILVVHQPTAKSAVL